MTGRASPAAQPAEVSNQERMKEITASIEKGIQKLFSSEKYTSWLCIMSKFHNYSLNNTILIHLQKPDATLVASFNKWKDSFGRNVNRGEKGIRIIAPAPFKKKVEIEKLDPHTRRPVLDASHPNTPDRQPVIEKLQKTKQTVKATPRPHPDREAVR